jgi:hypothetical protein
MKDDNRSAEPAKAAPTGVATQPGAENPQACKGARYRWCRGPYPCPPLCSSVIAISVEST